MMGPVLQADGRLLVPRRAETDDGSVGDGLVVIGPDDPQFTTWWEWLHRPKEGDT